MILASRDGALRLRRFWQAGSAIAGVPTFRRKRPRVIFFENIQHETIRREVLAVKSLKLRLRASGISATVSPFRKFERLNGTILPWNPTVKCITFLDGWPRSLERWRKHCEKNGGSLWNTLTHPLQNRPWPPTRMNCPLCGHVLPKDAQVAIVAIGCARPTRTRRKARRAIWWR